MTNSSLDVKLASLAALCDAIPPPDAAAGAAASRRLDRLTKPPGSLGQFESLLVRLAAATGQVCPQVERRAVLLAAADHGVAAEGVSAYPQAVTAQMVLNFLAGGAAINALARAAGARLILVDAGVCEPVTASPTGDVAFEVLRLGAGTGNIAREPAMSALQALEGLLAGAALVEREHERGLDVLALGEMGIANTTPTAAITSALTGAPPEQTVGRGTGVNDAALDHKRHIVQLALDRYGANAALPEAARTPHASALDTLIQLGGFEIAVLAGATLAAAARRVPVLLDGYITAAAALVAASLAPQVRPYLLASHRSAEPGHALALAHLGLTPSNGAGPLLDLGLRLGEGSGAALALPLIASACHAMREMATFEEAGVSG